MDSPNRDRPAEILLVEDSPTDALLARNALELTDARANLSTVCDGVEALAFLRREGKYGQVPRPDLILLDLNLPRKDGREVLEEVKGAESLRRIPVIILTTSQHETDIQRAYELHANCYVVKPVNFDRFVDVMQSVKDFWFAVATLPTRH